MSAVGEGRSTGAVKAGGAQVRSPFPPAQPCWRSLWAGCCSGRSACPLVTLVTLKDGRWHHNAMPSLPSFSSSPFNAQLCFLLSATLHLAPELMAPASSSFHQKRRDVRGMAGLSLLLWGLQFYSLSLWTFEPGISSSLDSGGWQWEGRILLHPSAALPLHTDSPQHSAPGGEDTARALLPSLAPITAGQVWLLLLGAGFPKERLAPFVLALMLSPLFPPGRTHRSLLQQYPESRPAGSIPFPCCLPTARGLSSQSLHLSFLFAPALAWQEQARNSTRA